MIAQSCCCTQLTFSFGVQPSGVLPVEKRSILNNLLWKTPCFLVREAAKKASLCKDDVYFGTIYCKYTQLAFPAITCSPSASSTILWHYFMPVVVSVGPHPALENQTHLWVGGCLFCNNWQRAPNRDRVESSSSRVACDEWKKKPFSFHSWWNCRQFRRQANQNNHPAASPVVAFLELCLTRPVVHADILNRERRRRTWTGAEAGVRVGGFSSGRRSTRKTHTHTDTHTPWR